MESLLKKSRQHGVSYHAARIILFLACEGAAYARRGIVLPEDEVSMRVCEGIEVHIREPMVAAATRILPKVVLNGVFAVLDAAFVSEPGAREGVRDRLPGAGHREIHVTG